MKKSFKSLVTAVLAMSIMFSGSTAVMSSAQGHSSHSSAISYDLHASKPATVKVKSAYSSGTSAVKIKWNKVKGASGYRVYRYNGKKYVKIANTKNTSFKDTKLKAGTRYKYKVKAFKRTSKGTVWGKASSPKKTATKPSTVKLSSFAAAQDSITLKWKKQTCDGYQIYQKKNGKYVKITTVKGAKKTSYKVTGLDAGTKYYFKVRAYTKDGAGKNLFSSFKGKAKTTKDIVWTELDKAYYHMACGYPTLEQCEMVRRDIVDYILDNYSDEKVLFEDKTAYRVWHGTKSESFNPTTMKFEFDPSDSKYQSSDAHCDHSIEMDPFWTPIFPMKNGYTKENYEAVQMIKKDCYEWLGYDALFNSLVSDFGTEESPMNFNIGIEKTDDAAAYVEPGADYYDEEGKDPMHIPQYTLWFCNKIIYGGPY